MMMKQPSKNSIEAMENSKIATISLEDIHKLMGIHTCFSMLNALIADLTISTNHISYIKNKKSRQTIQRTSFKKP
jgi:hypothetical protein